MSKRVLVAGLYHETNTFLKGATGLDGFQVREGEGLLEARGDASPLAGVLEAADERNWHVLPVSDLRATPGGAVSDEVVDLFWESFRAAVRVGGPHGIDGVFLVLHGAMVSESLTDVEGELLRRVRGLEQLSEVPVCGVLDPHANFTEAMAVYSECLVCYRENPHTDAWETAVDAACLLDRLMETGERPITALERPPVLWPPSGMATAEDPMRALEKRARTIEDVHPEILAVNVFAGFPFADVPDAGVGFSAVTVGDPEEAGRALRELSELAWSLKEEGNRAGLPLEEALRGAEEMGDGPVLLVEPSDNIGAGAPGENTGLLRAFVERDLEDAAAVINDPAAVREIGDARPGDKVRVVLGGKSGEIGAEPLTLEVEVVRRADGRFELEDPMSHLAARGGRRVEMGPSVLLRRRGVLVLVTSRKTPPFDLGQWRSVGVDPEDLAIIGIKAAAGHRRAYDPIATASYTVDLPGPCAENLARLPYRHVRRPVYPLDEAVRMPREDGSTDLQEKTLRKDGKV